MKKLALLLTSALLLFASVLLLSSCGVIGLLSIIGSKSNEVMIDESRDNIAPYLEIIPCRPDEETGKIILPSELYDNKDNVEFLGLTGSISFEKDKYGVVDTVCWKSHDFFTFDEHQKFVSKLDDYFGTKAAVDIDIIGQYTSKNYYWEDDTVPTVVVFYTSVRANHEEETDRIEIYWDMDAEMPD